LLQEPGVRFDADADADADAVTPGRVVMVEQSGGDG